MQEDIVQQELAIQDDFAYHYDAIYRSLICYEKRWKKFIADITKYVTPKDDLQVCDLGCGTGTFLPLLEETGFRNLVGVDLSRNMVRQARKKTKYTNFTVRPMKDTQLLPESFDGVTIFGSIHHTPNKSAVFHEANRI